jgi:hypothetical protein
MAQDRKEYRKAYYQAHKEELKSKRRAYIKAHKEEIKEYNKSHYSKEENTVRCRAYRESHKEEVKAYQREFHKEYYKSDVNSLGKSKASIRTKSLRYLNKYGTKIPGYEIHHCCTYTEPYKFIYCSKDKHQQIHAYLRDNNIQSDSDHYDLIKHLFDDKVVIYGITK